ELRKKLSASVSAWSARSGTPHGVIHNKLREISGGPAVAQATKEQSELRLKTLQGWFVGRKSSRRKLGLGKWSWVHRCYCKGICAVSLMVRTVSAETTPPIISMIAGSIR